MIKKKKLPAPPMALATAPVHDPDLDRILSAEVASRADRPGRRQADRVHRRAPGADRRRGVGLSADAYQTWRIGRYADPRAPAPRRAVDLQHPLARQAPLQPADDLLAQPVRRPQVGALQGEVRLVELAVQPLLLAAQPGVVEQQRLDRVDAGVGDLALGGPVRVGVLRRPAGAPIRSLELADDVVAAAPDLRRPRTRDSSCTHGWTSGGSASRGDDVRCDSVWWASSSRTSGR